MTDIKPGRMGPTTIRIGSIQRLIMDYALSPRRRTPSELIAAAGRYSLLRHRGYADIFSIARTIENNLSRPLEYLRAEQDKAIEAIVNHAWEHSPFYRKRFAACGFKPGDVKTRADLARLPEVTKSDLADNADDVLCLPREQLEHSQTGGTSGIGLTLYRDHHVLAFRRAIDLVTPRYYGWRNGQWQGWLWGASADIIAPRGLKARLMRQLGDRTYYVDAMHLTEENYRRFIDLTRLHRPTYLSAYPTIAFDLATRIQAGEIQPFRVPVVCLTAEPVYDFQRRKISETFADHVYERYGSREIGTAALECPAHNGLHYFTESVCFEDVDRGPDMPGKSLVVTDLVNRVMPLIRYQTGDFGEIDRSPCSCGRTSPRIKNIQGRETDVVWCPDGHGVAGFMIVSLVGSQEIHAPVQLEQDRLDHLTIRIEGQTGQWAAQLRRLTEIFKREISADMTFDVQWVDRIERAPSGKYRYVMSSVQRPTLAVKSG